MTSVNLSNIAITKAKFRYSMSELVDDFLKKKLSKEVREYAKNELGIDHMSTNLTIFQKLILTRVILLNQM